MPHPRHIGIVACSAEGAALCYRTICSEAAAFLGPHAHPVLLGARLPAEALRDATLDSQNRFYGVAFTLYGVLLFLSATDLPRYATVLRCVLWVFFAAGLARLVSIASHGVPPPLVLALLMSELAAPPLIHFWLAKTLRAG